MKKILSMMVIAIAAITLIGCTNTHETPYNTTTNLWPAYDEDTELYGYINKSGKFAIMPQFAAAGYTFSNGLALVEVGKKEAFINTSGKVQESVSFDSAEPFINGYAMASLNGGTGFLTKNLNWAIQPLYSMHSDMSSEGLALTSLGNKYVYIKTNGQYLTYDGQVLTFPYATAFEGGYAVVCDNTNRYTDSGEKRIPTYYVIDTKGKVVIEDGIYAELRNLGFGLFASIKKSMIEEKDAQYRMINTKEETIGKAYDRILPFSENGLARVAVKDGYNYHYGYINKKGEVVISIKYDEAEPFYGKYTLIELDDQEKIIDEEGSTVLVLSEKESVWEIVNGLALIQKVGETTITYSWIKLDNSKEVYSWTFKTGSYYAPAQAGSARSNMLGK